MENREDRIKAIRSETARRLALPQRGVEAVARLLAEGASVAFISRYRKEMTGCLDEVAVRMVETTLARVEELFDRKDFVAAAIENAGAMTDSLRSRLDSATEAVEVEDIYAPFKPRRRTRATMAREKGLEPLARIIMAGNTVHIHEAAERFAYTDGVADADEAISGASDIIAEWASESLRLRGIARNTYRRHAQLCCCVAKGKEEDIMSSPFAGYASFQKNIRHVSSHQYLAIRRAEREGFVKVRYILPDDQAAALGKSLRQAFRPRGESREAAIIAGNAVDDAYARLLRPSLESEISASLKEEADRVAVGIFSENLRQLLLAPPLKGLRILAIDPGYRSGCKVAALDSQGNLLADSVVYPVAPRCDEEGARTELQRLLASYGLEAVALGNGTASRETERFLRRSGLIDGKRIFVVSESGASVYSASEAARREMPDKDVTVRGAVSIGRRLIDPLAELVKIDPGAIGVGQYQHDVNQTLLKEALDFTVTSCVNAVGVDVNTASECLLSYVSGIGEALASNIVAYRTAHGAFPSRKALLRVSRLGEKAFQQAAGFLRVPGASEPLDNTGIHPESYHVVEKIASCLGVNAAELPGNEALLDKVDPARMAAVGIGGEETIADIVAELRKPGRDPRLDDSSGCFTPSVSEFGQLSEGMVLPGMVENITAFGAFVALGLKERGLLHISRISKKRISSVSDILKLGQQIEVRVIDLDPSRGRISLELADLK